MNNFKNIIRIILAILLLSLFGYIAIKGLSLVFAYLNSLQKEVAASIIAASSTIIVTALSITLLKYKEIKKNIEFEIREKKIPVYIEFINFLMKVMNQERLTGEKLTEDEMIIFFQNFTEKLLIWGSDEVIKNYTLYKTKLIIDADNGVDGNFDSLFVLENLLYSIRKDTGHKNKNMKKGDILRLFINDVDNYL